MLLRLAKWGFFLGGFLVFLGLVSVFRGQGGEEKNVLIPRGIGTGRIASLLEQEGIFSNPTMFKALVFATGGNRRVKAGEYTFRTEMGPVNAMLVLYFGTPVEHLVTLPEGWNARQISAILAAKGLVNPEKFLSLVLSKKAAEKYRFQAPSLEGFLYPDTYTFSRVDGEERIVDRMIQRFFSKVDQELISQARKMGFSLEQLVTFASIIEKETGVPTERELISSVFHNRLKKKMRLQSDPTTIYGIANFNGNLTRKDLLTATPYNTYKISGLPPGAIASPGLGAIRAAVYPANTPYLYFVSNNSGGHLFSATYAEHHRNVQKYQKHYTQRQADSTRQPGNIRDRK